MRVLILSNVHGNTAALKAVLRDPHDVVVCLGDIVGFLRTGSPRLPCAAAERAGGVGPGQPRIGPPLAV